MTRESILNVEANLEFNRSRWGDRRVWEGKDGYGYHWGGGHQQRNGDIARFADQFLRSALPFDNYNLKILELSPGAGRFTAEAIRYARAIDLLDMNEACLELCRERFRMHPVPMRLYLNNGRSCEMLEDSDYDLVVSFDSMVHMHPEIIRGYVMQLRDRLAPGGILWLDHSGRGIKESGHRTAMTEESMAALAIEARLELISQRFRNSQDCVSVMRKST